MRSGDNSLLITTFSLTLFGVAMISSASTIIAFNNDVANSYYFWWQLRSLAIGVILFYLVQKIDYRIWKKFSIPLLGLSILGLIAVFIPGIAADWGTSNSWIKFPIIWSLQPVEVAKFWLIVYVSAWMSARYKEVKDFQKWFIPFSIIVGLILGLLALQPDFGSILVITMISSAMYFAAGAKIKHMAFGATIAGFIGYIAVNSKQYIHDRFLAFLDHSIDPMGVGYHIQQALIAIGSGWTGGLGFGNSKQKFEYLPEAQSDSIFAIISEELGLIRALILVAAFLFLVYRGYSIANNAPDRFGKLLAIGISTWIGFQAFLNIMVNLSLAPITGVTLPLISHGGSSLLTTLGALAVLYNISKHKKDSYTTQKIQKKKIHYL